MHECRPEVACTQTLPLSHYQLRIINRAQLALFPKLTPSRHAVITQSEAHTASTCLLACSHSAFPPPEKMHASLCLAVMTPTFDTLCLGLRNPRLAREKAVHKSDQTWFKSCCKYLLFSCEEERAKFWQDSTIYSLVIRHQHHDFGTWRVSKSMSTKTFVQICVYL